MAFLSQWATRVVLENDPYVGFAIVITSLAHCLRRRISVSFSHYFAEDGDSPPTLVLK